ncbi:MAG TPA: hypothetical protein VH331_05580 [Allosphingosinicella sp.]|nr:hypothetical protein [Allosphingosinicella sp.]
MDVEPGLSIMEGAVRNGIPGIDANFGGAMACATCHVYADPKWVALIVPAKEEEHDMLDFLFGKQPAVLLDRGKR